MTKIRFFPLHLVAWLSFFASAVSGYGEQEAGWLAYDGFDYRTPVLDGADGGGGAWKTEWRRSAAGGVVLIEPGFDFTDTNGWRLASSGRRAEIRARGTAGAYRDFNFNKVEAENSKMVFWLSFLARAEGAPFDVGSDEMTLQLRAEKDVPLLTIGVMGRLNEWRIRADGLGRHFSRGAEKRPPEKLSWIVVRVDVDQNSGAQDAVYLWVNPPGSREPSIDRVNARILGADIWNMEHPFRPMRLRVGTIGREKEGMEKIFSWDEIRLGMEFSHVAPAFVSAEGVAKRAP